MIDIAWLATTGPCKKFSAAQRVPCPGGPDAAERAMYILLTGRVDVYKASAAGGTQAIGCLLPGDVFGGREYFTDVDDCDYKAGVDSVVYVVNEGSFNDLSWSKPEILFEVLKGAYMPLRKVTASQKKLASGAESAGGPKTDDAPAGASGAKAGAAARGEGTQSLTQSAVPMAIELFPAGHKGYPGITKPEYAKLVFQKDYSCPFCKKSFSDFKVFRSKLFEAEPMRYDLRRFYTDFQTEWYDIITCHYCFFSTFHNYFTDPKPIQKVKFENELTAARASVLLNFDAERDIDYVFTTHYLAMICAEGYLSAGRQIRARAFGNLSWLYEDVADEEMARISAEKAAEAYEAVYAESRLTPVQEQVTCLSIAGMQYRAGIDRNMKKFLFTAKTIKMGDRTYAKVAEDFMFDIRGENE